MDLKVSRARRGKLMAARQLPWRNRTRARLSASQGPIQSKAWLSTCSLVVSISCYIHIYSHLLISCLLVFVKNIKRHSFVHSRQAVDWHRLIIKINKSIKLVCISFTNSKSSASLHVIVASQMLSVCANFFKNGFLFMCSVYFDSHFS